MSDATDDVRRSVGDLFGPFFKVRFYNPLLQPVPVPTDINRVEAFTLTQAKNISLQKEMDSRHLENYAANLVVQCRPGSSLMTLTLTPPYNEAIDLLKNHVFQYGALVGVKWGYSKDNLITKERLFIINQPKVQFGRDITITISGIDTFSRTLKYRTPNSKYDRKLYPSDLDLLEFLANRHGCDIKIEKSSLASLNDPNSSLRTSKLDIPIERAENDWDLFKLICKGNNVVFQIGSGNSIILYDRRKVSDMPTDYTLFWYDQATSNKDIPMMTFTTNPLPTIFAPKEYINTLTISIDPDTGTVKTSKKDPSTTKDEPSIGDPKLDKTVAGTGQYRDQVIVTEGSIIVIPSYTTVAGEELASGISVSVPNNANNAMDKVETEGQDAALVANATAVAVALGHPDVIPPMNIEVRGTGIFDGPYYMIEAKHSIGTNGYEMTLNLLKTISDTGNSKNVKEPPDTSIQPPPNTWGSDDTPINK